MSRGSAMIVFTLLVGPVSGLEASLSFWSWSSLSWAMPFLWSSMICLMVFWTSPNGALIPASLDPSWVGIAPNFEASCSRVLRAAAVVQ